MLTKEELQSLSDKDLKKYNSLDKGAKEIFAISFRQSEKSETRGRHKKNCDCQKCVSKRSEREKIISSQSSTEEQPKEVQQVQQVVLDSEKQVHEKESLKSNEDILNEDLQRFRNSQQNIVSENNVETNNSETQSNNQQQQQQQNTQENAYKQTVDISEFISGAMFLMFLDYVFPVFLKYVVGMFNKKFKRIKPEAVEKLQLTAKEKQYLEPSAEHVVKYIFADANPLVVFVVATMGIYSGKFLLLNDTSDFFESK